MAKTFNIEKVYAVVNRTLPKGKVYHVEFAGGEVVYAPEGTPATDYAYDFAREHDCILADQYVRDEAIQGHQWSMNHIACEMKRRSGETGFTFAAITGTCSTILAARRYLRPQFKGNIKLLGVASMNNAQKVPGSRARENLAELKTIKGFGWELHEHPDRFLDFPLIESVPRDEAYAVNAELHHEADSQAGPTSALLLAGVSHLLRERVERDSIASLKNEDGFIVFVLFFMDSFLAYTGELEYRSHFQR